MTDGLSACMTDTAWRVNKSEFLCDAAELHDAPLASQDEHCAHSHPRGRMH